MADDAVATPKRRTFGSVRSGSTAVKRMFAAPPPLPVEVQAKMVHLHNVHCIPLGVTMQLANVVEQQRKQEEAEERRLQKMKADDELRHAKRLIQQQQQQYGTEAISFTQERPGEFYGAGMLSATASTGEGPDGAALQLREEEFQLPDYLDSPYETIFHDVGKKLKLQSQLAQKKQRGMMQLGAAANGALIAPAQPPAGKMVRRQSFVRQQLAEVQNQQQGILGTTAATEQRRSSGGPSVVAPTAGSILKRQPSLSRMKATSPGFANTSKANATGGSSSETDKSATNKRGRKKKAGHVCKKGCSRAAPLEETQQLVTLRRLLHCQGNRHPTADEVLLGPPGTGDDRPATMSSRRHTDGRGEVGNEQGQSEALVLPQSPGRDQQNPGGLPRSNLPVTLGVPKLKLAGLFQVSSDLTSAGGVASAVSPLVPKTGLEAQQMLGTASHDSVACPGGSARVPDGLRSDGQFPSLHHNSNSSHKKKSKRLPTQTPQEMQMEQEELNKVKHVYMNSGVQYGTGAATHRPAHISDLLLADEERTRQLGGISHRPVPPKPRQTVFKPSTKFASAEATLKLGSLTAATHRCLKNPAGAATNLGLQAMEQCEDRTPVRNERGGVSPSPSLQSAAGSPSPRSRKPVSDVVGFTPAKEVAPPFLALPSRPITVPAPLVLGYCTLVEKQASKEGRARTQSSITAAASKGREGPHAGFGSSAARGVGVPRTTTPGTGALHSPSHPTPQSPPHLLLGGKHSKTHRPNPSGSRIMNMQFDD